MRGFPPSIVRKQPQGTDLLYTGFNRLYKMLAPRLIASSVAKDDGNWQRARCGDLDTLVITARRGRPFMKL